VAFLLGKRKIFAALYKVVGSPLSCRDGSKVFKWQADHLVVGGIFQMKKDFSTHPLNPGQIQGFVHCIVVTLDLLIRL